MLQNLGFGRVRISFYCPRHHIPARNSARRARRARHARHSGGSHRGTNPHPTRVRVSRMTGVNNKLPQNIIIIVIIPIIVIIIIMIIIFINITNNYY